MALQEEEDESQLQLQPKRIKTMSSSEKVEILQSNHTLLPEIEIEILSRLPVESLLRCKSVCKSWRSLISDSRFVKYHLSLSNSNREYAHHRLISRTGLSSVNWCSLHDVVYDKSIKKLELDYPLKTPQKRVCIVGSCNGLLCINVKDYDDQELKGTMFIWNPSTRRSNRLPYSGFKLSSFIRYGFGYDESSDDYKVVLIVFNGAGYNTRVMIYSLKSGNWKGIGDFPHSFCFGYFGKFSNGALHWAAKSDSSSCCSIISLDLATNTYGEVMQPVYDKGVEPLRLTVLGEWLCLLCEHTKFQETDVWVMKDYGVKDSWTKLVSIPKPLDLFWWPLTITNDGKILLCHVRKLALYDAKLVLYDAKNGSFSELINNDGGFVVDITVESLVSPNAPRN